MSGVHNRFRSVKRNRETDERRIALIQEAASAAVADAISEATGLRDRIAQERRSLISPVEESDSGKPSPSHRSDVISLEQQILAAEQRLQELRDHFAFLRNLEFAASRVPRWTGNRQYGRSACHEHAPIVRTGVAGIDDAFVIVEFEAADEGLESGEEAVGAVI
jgi:hypothetical protein